jgi:hypothetical protein
VRKRSYPIYSSSCATVTMLSNSVFGTYDSSPDFSESGQKKEDIRIQNYGPLRVWPFTVVALWQPELIMPKVRSSSGNKTFRILSEKLGRGIL